MTSTAMPEEEPRALRRRACAEAGWLSLSPSLDIRVSADGRGSTLVRLRGDLDVAGAESFVSTVTQLIDDRAVRRVLLGFDELDFIDVSGARSVRRIATAVSTTNRRLVVLNPAPTARRVLALCGLDHLVSMPSGGDDAA